MNSTTLWTGADIANDVFAMILFTFQKMAYSHNIYINLHKYITRPLQTSLPYRQAPSTTLTIKLNPLPNQIYPFWWHMMPLSILLVYTTTTSVSMLQQWMLLYFLFFIALEHKSLCYNPCTFTFIETRICGCVCPRRGYARRWSWWLRESNLVKW